MIALVPMIGRKFGRLTVVARMPNRSGRVFYQCKCSCGNPHAASAGGLRGGKTTSCGCFKRENSERWARTHGAASHDPAKRFPEYNVWKTMRQRCINPANKDWKNYGARGVRVYKRWDRFDLFIVDMGRRPSPRHSIDRYPNNDGDYKPSNCRWATAKQQANNTRRKK